MKKQRISLLLILLANILLLADVVLPHHHHETSVCFSFFGTHSSSDVHHHQLPVQDNTSSNDCSGCALRNTDILLNNVERNHFKQLEINAFDFVCQVADVVLIKPSFNIAGYFKPTSSPPVRLTYVLGIQGLRAPPVA